MHRTRVDIRAPLAIEICELHKSYAEFSALAGLALEVRPGEVFGFLGPNGAGKTTTMRILMGLLTSTSGSASILGLDCFRDRVALKRLVGYLPDVPFFYDYLSGVELLRFVGDMHGLEREEVERRIRQLSHDLALEDALDDFATNYSLGMKKKLGLAMALIHEPKVLLLDEPAAGLDPLANRHLKNSLRQCAASGRTVLLSTHQLDFAESVCDRLGVIHRGRTVAVDTPARLRGQITSSTSPSNLEEVFLALTQDSSNPDAAPKLQR